MGRTISQFYFDNKNLSTEQVLQALRARTGLNIQFEHGDFCCEGFTPIEFELDAERGYIALICDMVVFARFYKKGENTHYLLLVLESVLLEMGCTNEYLKNKKFPDWVNKKWADIGWFTRRREIYK